MKLKNLLPIAGVGLASISIPLVSCSNNKTINIHWNLEDGYYESKTRVLEFTDYETSDDGANAYYDFIDEDPQILADDLMFGIFNNFFSGYYVETAVGEEEITSWTPYQIDLNLSDITLKQNSDKTTDCYVTYSLKIKFIETVEKLCYGEFDFEVQNFKISLLGAQSDSGFRWWLTPEYTLHESPEEVIEDLINDEDWSYRYLFKRSIGHDWTEDYTFDSSYVKKAVKNADESAIEQITKAFKMLHTDSYFYINVGIKQHE